MSLIAQAALLLGISLVSEAAYRLLKLPIPGNVLGMILLFLLLCARIVKPEQIKGVSNLLLSNMALLFIPGVASILIHYGVLRGHWLGFLGAVLVSSLLTFAVTGWIAQYMLSKKQ